MVFTVSVDFDLISMSPAAQSLPLPSSSASTSWSTTATAKNPPNLLAAFPVPEDESLPDAFELLLGFKASIPVRDVTFVEFVVTFAFADASSVMFPSSEITFPATFTWESFTTTETAREIGSDPTVASVSNVTSLEDDRRISFFAFSTASAPTSTLVSATMTPTARGIKYFAKYSLEAFILTRDVAFAVREPPAVILPSSAIFASEIFTLAMFTPVRNGIRLLVCELDAFNTTSPDEVILPSLSSVIVAPLTTSNMDALISGSMSSFSPRLPNVPEVSMVTHASSSAAFTIKFFTFTGPKIWISLPLNTTLCCAACINLIRSLSSVIDRLLNKPSPVTVMEISSPSGLYTRLVKLTLPISYLPSVRSLNEISFICLFTNSSVKLLMPLVMI